MPQLLVWYAAAALSWHATVAGMLKAGTGMQKAGIGMLKARTGMVRSRDWHAESRGWHVRTVLIYLFKQVQFNNILVTLITDQSTIFSNITKE